MQFVCLFLLHLVTFCYLLFLWLFVFILSKNFFYHRPFHKTLPRSSAFDIWISILWNGLFMKVTITALKYGYNVDIFEGFLLCSVKYTFQINFNQSLYTYIRGEINQECKSLHKIWANKVTEVHFQKVAKMSNFFRSFLLLSM